MARLTYFIAALVFCLFLISCHKSNPINLPPDSFTVWTIDNWNLGSSYAVNFSNLASAPVDQNGKFRIPDLPAPPAERLLDIKKLFDGYSTRADISDESAKFFAITNVNIVDRNSNLTTVHLVKLEHSNSLSAPIKGDYKLQLIYVDKKVTINGMARYDTMGTSIKRDGWIEPWASFFDYNQLELSPGWNLLKCSLSEIDTTGLDEIFKVEKQDLYSGCGHLYTELNIGTETIAQDFPLSFTYYNQHSAAIYTSADLHNLGGYITGLSWYSMTSEPFIMAYSIFLKDITDTVMPSITLSSIKQGATCVAGCETMMRLNRWIDYNFMKPRFYHQPDKSLLVIVSSWTSEYGAPGGTGMGCSMTANYLHQVWNSDRYPLNEYGLITIYRPNIRVNFDLVK